MKIERGCEKDSPIPGKWKIGDIEYRRCPVKMLDARVNIYIKAYNFLQSGILPSEGGWLKQTAKYIEAMEIIGQEISKTRAEK